MTANTDNSEMIQAKRNVFVLIACQALSTSGLSLIMTISALAGQMLAEDKSMATFPLALTFTAMTLTTIPAAMFMGRVGRRVGFTVGQVFGIIGGGIACYAILDGSFWLFAFGSMLIGAHQAFVQHYRFAAAESAPENYRSRAISWVMGGGIISAFLGPQLAKSMNDFFEPVLFAGGFLSIIGLSFVTILLLQFINVPKPALASISTKGRPLIEIARQPLFIVAVLSGMIGYSMMTLVMTATPLAMEFCGYAFHEAATVIQWHVLAMYVPSFFTGDLIKRYQALPVIIAGICLYGFSLAINLSGISIYHFSFGLIFLGLGWNFMFVGATSLLTECYEPEERSKVQALNDFLVFGTVAIASFSSGALHSTIGWSAVILGMVIPLSLVVLMIIRYLIINKNRVSKMKESS